MRPITEVLIEFPLIIPAALFAASDEPAPDPVVDWEERNQALAEARKAGMEDARIEAEAASADQLAALGHEHEAALADARARWAADEGASLARALTEGLTAIEADIARHLSTVLVPFLVTSARTRVAEEIKAALADLLAGGHGGLIEVRGPADLVAPIRAAFAGRDAVVIAEADGPEVSVCAGDTVIASQVEAWTSRLHAALATESA